MWGVDCSRLLSQLPIQTAITANRTKYPTWTNSRSVEDGTRKPHSFFMASHPAFPRIPNGTDHSKSFKRGILILWSRYHKNCRGLICFFCHGKVAFSL